ncbi:hypothetical protein INT43_000443 [Umbelopsis isabellina]|uniref:ATP-dependent (S)-NAD(P)H-hydrate dehydratase n=1 Tax=Mortierella isabellina TaxID=91625 RepID=A0A8H7Q3T5_MORIS|nr:hypothetical protein INT43_000443 [Umbelopsis isabellina]
MPPKFPDLGKIKQLIPPLAPEMHKGQAGRIGIVGGSEDYTGAPYFSGISAMKLGADLCHIFCEPGAGTVIKLRHNIDRTEHRHAKESKLSSQEIVDNVASVFSRLHVLVVGPGLSRDSQMLESAKGIIEKAKQQDMAIVLDADGLFLVQNHPEIVQNYQKAVLTPNVVEFKRLCEAMKLKFEDSDKDKMAEKLSNAFGGVTIVQKGSSDLISNGKEVLICDAEGGLKRMGGQGDILSGVIATFLAWGKGYQDGVWKHDSSLDQKEISLLSAWAGCRIVRECAKRAFEKHGRAVLTSNLVEEIGPAYASLFENGNKSKM